MSKTLLITMLALVATATAKPYVSALSSLYGAAGPYAAAYTLPGAVPAPLPAPIPAPVPAAVAPVSAYQSEFAAGFPYGGLGFYNVPNVGPLASLPPSYAYVYGDYAYAR